MQGLIEKWDYIEGKICALLLGAAVTLAVTMAGMALGSFAAGAILRRRQPRNSGRTDLGSG